MRFIYVYVTWMIVVIAARMAGLITKTAFESLFVIGVAFAAGVSYKSLCEVHYAFDKRHALCRADSKLKAQ